MDISDSWIFIILITIFYFEQSFGCISTAPRAFSGGPTSQSFAPIPAPAAPASQLALASESVQSGRAIAAAANRGPSKPIGQQSGQPDYFNHFFGDRVAFHDFSSEGYNAEGGGPVSESEALSCNFDKQACCWANVPPPDDQLDWFIARGPPQPRSAKVPITPNGNYLIAYARDSAPSDEAQFASCAIGCASSPIVVRAKHWQTANVLLQVCQRESFPNTVNFNPLLNCQEFPFASGLATSELVLPKASLVDIVFVASNFVGEEDAVILDDIEVVYQSNGDDCGVDEMNTKSASDDSFKYSSAVTHKEAKLKQSVVERTLETFSKSTSSVVSIQEDCALIKCTFESKNACNYVDAHQTESIRGLTTGFQVVKGQFMNRVTGVREGTEGKYYAATFLFPREIAGLAVDLKRKLKESVRLRFQYYEGTHGVQLKGCCDSLEHCVFATDKFVSITDRMWKVAQLICPPGTSKILFVCENTRTNQGACALDDIQVVERNDLDIRSARTIC